MNFEQLKIAWRASLAIPPDASELERMNREIRACDQRFRRDALLRRIYGTGAFGLTLAMLAMLIVLPGVLWPGMRVAIAVWSASMLACIVGLWRVRRGRRLRPDAPLAVHLEDSLGNIRREMIYYRALRWTFWLPFGVGLGFALAWRAPNGGGASLFLILGTTVFWLWGFIYAGRTWLKRFEPLAAQLESMLREARCDDGAPR